MLELKPEYTGEQILAMIKELRVEHKLWQDRQLNGYVRACKLLGKPISHGVNHRATVKRRAKNKVARVSRRVNR